MKILVAEDDSVLREAVKAHLNDLGHEVVEARDGREAMDVLYPDGVMDSSIMAVITDMNMPRASGLELLQYISRRGSNVPCLLQSSLDTAAVAGSKMLFLPTAVKAFDFAQYKPKLGLRHITEFLESLA